MDVTIDFVRYFIAGLLFCSPLLIFFTLVVFSVGLRVGHLEKWSIYDSLYWTVITATTVGYGDFRPKKHRSRVLTIAVVLVGMMYTGIIVSLAVMATTESLKKNIDFSNVVQRLNPQQVEQR